MAVTDDYQTWARELLERAAGGDKALEAQAAALESVMRSLTEVLVPIFGRLALRLLLERAVQSVAPSFPFASRIGVHEEGIDAAGITGDLAGIAPATVQEGFERLLGTFLEDLSGLVGRDLARRLVAEAWRDGKT